MSTKPVADAVLWPLESSYIAPSISSLKVQGIERIVVLAGGGGFRAEDGRRRTERRRLEDQKVRR